MTTEPWWLPDAPREFSIRLSALGIAPASMRHAQDNPDEFRYQLYKKLRERLREHLFEKYGRRHLNGVLAWRVYVPDPPTVALGMVTGIVSAKLIVDPRLTESHRKSAA